jgi:hypothetical protein
MNPCGMLGLLAAAAAAVFGSTAGAQPAAASGPPFRLEVTDVSLGSSSTKRPPTCVSRTPRDASLTTISWPRSAAT